MSDQTDILTRTLSRLGLEAMEVEIYLYLLEKGTKSALEISRQKHCARTRVYRILDKLKAKGLVAEKFDTLGLKFTARPHSSLDLLVAERRGQLDAVKAQLPLIKSQLDGLSGSENGSKVLYHHGVDGLKHVTWNSLSARGVLRIMEVSESMTAFLPQEFSEKVREQLVANRIHTRQLTNLKKIQAHTNVAGIVRKFWSPRYIAPESISIKSEILIYNDVTAMYHFQNNDIFCVEIVSRDLSRMQKQLFDFVWAGAVPMKKIGEFGEATL